MKVDRPDIPEPSPALLAMEEKARSIGRLLGRAVDGTGFGFVLLLFDFGPSGFITYLSNADRLDMIKALENLLRNLKKRTQ